MLSNSNNRVAWAIADFTSKMELAHLACKIAKANCLGNHYSRKSAREAFNA